MPIVSITETDPKWQKDADAIACKKCNSSFGLFTRRHHCRMCGFIFCNDHCGIKLEDQHKQHVRCCFDCVNEYSLSETAAAMAKKQQQNS